MTRSIERCAILLLALSLAACSGPAPRYLNYPSRSQAQTTSAATGETPRVDAGQSDPEQIFLAALKLKRDKQPQEAKDAFARLARDFPQYAGPLNDLGVLQAQGKQRDQAIASFAKAIAADGHNAFAWGWLGILYRESGDYARAEQAYRKAIELKPDDAPAHLNLGILYDVYLRRPAEALAQYAEYQRIAGQSNLVVGVWIRQLRAKLGPGGMAATTVAGAMP